MKSQVALCSSLHICEDTTSSSRFLSRQKTSVLPLLFACALVGCAASTQVTPVPGIRPSAPSATTRFTISKGDSFPEQPFEILGKVYTYKRAPTIFNKPNEDDQAKLLIRPAKKLGADAIIGLHSSPFNGTDRNTIHRWTSGLAVRFLGLGEVPESQRGDIVVGICPPKLSAKMLSDPKRAAKLDTWVREAARYWLECRGYYSYVMDSTFSEVDSLGLVKMQDSQLAELGAPLVDRILLLELQETSGTNVGLAAVKRATLRAHLYSKRKREFVWSNRAVGSTFGLGLANVIAMSGDVGNSAAIYKAVREAMKSLPPPQ